MSKAIYAISADPITYGHINIIERAAKLFDELIVAIGDNADKKYMFNFTKRKHLASVSLNHLPNVCVKTFRGMLSDFATEEQADVIIRGVRNGADFDFETTVHQVGLTQSDDLETLLMIADQSKTHISSSVVKGLVKSQGDVTKYVPLVVKNALENSIRNLRIIGVTGSVACGKSTFGEMMARYSMTPTHNIDLDALGHRILSGNPTLPNFVKKALSTIAERFPEAVVPYVEGEPAIRVDRKLLGALVFGVSPVKIQNRRDLTALMSEPLALLLRKEISKFNGGTILINAALLAEGNLLDMCNNHVYLVEVSEEEQIERMIEHRGLTRDQAIDRINSQPTNYNKSNLISDKIKKDGYGKLIKIDGAATFTKAYVDAVNRKSLWEMSDV